MDLQTLVAGLIVAACAAFLVRRWARFWLGKTSGLCSACSVCPEKKTHSSSRSLPPG